MSFLVTDKTIPHVAVDVIMYSCPRPCSRGQECNLSPLAPQGQSFSTVVYKGWNSNIYCIKSLMITAVVATDAPQYKEGDSFDCCSQRNELFVFFYQSLLVPAMTVAEGGDHLLAD